MKRQTAKLPTVKAQAGFTLIELIMVIVILGVLSAYALPRFADLGGEARTASINGLAGAIRSAANIAHAQQLADGTTGNTAVNLDGAANLAMANGYPTVASIITAAQVDTTNDYSSTTSGTSVILYLAPDEEGSGASGERCRVTYTQAAANGTPNVAVDTDDC